jgi:hypothetical protein
MTFIQGDPQTCIDVFEARTGRATLERFGSPRRVREVAGDGIEQLLTALLTLDNEGRPRTMTSDAQRLANLERESRERRAIAMEIPSVRPRCAGEGALCSSGSAGWKGSSEQQNGA